MAKKPYRPESGLNKPPDISTWTWLSHRYADLSLWQHCLVAATDAGFNDVTATALKMYLQRGGTLVERSSRLFPNTM